MTPIINPMWFYWIDVLGNAKILIGIFAVAVFILSLFCLFAFLAHRSGDTNCTREDDAKYAPKYRRASILLVLLSVLISTGNTFIPSEKTMYKMMIANVATEENLDGVLDAIKNGVDYIFDKIDNK